MKTDKQAAPETEATGAGTKNRTGVGNSPDMALDLIREAQRTPPDPEGDAEEVAEYRRPYLEEGVITGSMPPPSEVADSLLLDKLGERLAFERQGVRLYECLIGKVKVLGTPPGGPEVEDLEHILEEEGEHFGFLQRAVVQSGGDPTLQTPCANITGVLSQGIMQVLTDPRTTVAQCLEGILNAELADNEGWSMLLKLVDARGAVEFREEIEKAEENEREHLSMVRGWLTALVLGADAEGEPVEGAPKRASKPKKGAAKPKSKPSGRSAK